MDKKTVFAQFFRSISVHLPKAGSDCYYFRSIPVQFEGINAGRNIFPEHIRSLLLPDIWRTQMLFFRSISVQGVCVFSYICTGKSTKFSTSMAGTIKDMSQIKQVLQLKQLGESNRGIARKLPIDKETVNGYTKTIQANA